MGRIEPTLRSQKASAPPRSRRCSVALVMAPVVLLGGCEPKETKILLEPSQALGYVLAQEAAQVAASKKQIALIEPDANWGPVSTAETAFKSALAKQGYSTLVAKAANLGDPMRRGPVGLKAEDFFEALQKAGGAGAIVSFAGAPCLARGDVARLPATHPPILVVATATLGNVPGVRSELVALGQLLDTRIIQLAVIDGSTEPASTGATKADLAQQVFSQNYRILRRPD